MNPEEILREPVAVTQQDPYPIGQRLFMHDERLTGMIVNNLHKRIAEKKQQVARSLSPSRRRPGPKSEMGTGLRRCGRLLIG